MSITKDQILETLEGVSHPDGGDIVSRGCVVNAAVCDTNASVRLCYTQGQGNVRQPGRETLSSMGKLVESLIRSLAKARGLEPFALIVEFVDHAGDVVLRLKSDQEGSSAQAPKQKQQQQKQKQQGAQPSQNDSATGVPGVANIIAVGAGKGGVGKSTVAINLAVALARQGRRVGILDGDIYGPSLPTMLGLGDMDQTVVESILQPFEVHGVRAITMGKLVEPDKPLIWRGPMAHGAFNQLIERTEWGELDDLIIDLPPGTGDVPLTLAQSVKLTGAVIVCTPQKVAQDDALRATKMFESLGVEVLGLVENMSYFVGDDGKEYDIFGRGGAEQMAQRLAIPFLGAVPINTALRANLDAGDPTRNFDPETAGGDQLPKALEEVARNTLAQITLAQMHAGARAPSLTIS